MSGASGTNPGAAWDAGREAVLLVDTSSRGRLQLTGSARQTFLHRITTNDINGLAPGGATPTLLVTAKGRMIERLFVICREDDLLVVTTDGGRESARDAITKYIVVDDVQVHDLTDETFQLTLFGPRAAECLAAAGLETGELRSGAWHRLEMTGHALTVTCEAGLDGPAFVIIGERAAANAVRTRLAEHGAALGLVETDTDGFEPLRVAAGLPARGHEITEELNPLEARQEDALSFEKGCYIGQEVLARLRTYDKVGRVLVRLDVDGANPLPRAATVGEGPSAGFVTSAEPIPVINATVALAVVSRDDADGGEVTVYTEDGPRRACVTGAPATARDIRVAAPEKLAPGKKRFGQ